jgi:hypothetical protein
MRDWRKAVIQEKKSDSTLLYMRHENKVFEKIPSILRLSHKTPRRKNPRKKKEN